MIQRSDTDRLEWLERNIRVTPIAITWDGYGISRGYNVEHQAPTLRKTIDAAMDAEERG